MGSWSHPFAQARFEYSWHIESHHIWWFVYLPSFPSTFSTCVPPKNGCPPPSISQSALKRYEVRESRTKKGMYFFAHPATGRSQMERPKA